MQPHDEAPDRQALLDLADLQIQGTATADQTAQLEAMLIHDPEAQREYLRYALVHGQLGLTVPAMPNISGCLPSTTQSGEADSPKLNDARRSTWPALVAFAVAASVLGIVVVRLAREPIEPRQPIAATAPKLETQAMAFSYDHRKPPLGMVGTIGNRRDATGPLTLTVEQGATDFQTKSGASLRVQGPALFGINTEESGVLYRGSVHAKLSDPASRFSVTTANLRILDLGTEFEVDVIDDQHIAVRVLDGQVDVQSRIRLPLYYWNFDSSATTDGLAAAGVPLTFGSRAKRTGGIVGTGAVQFDNSHDAFIEINEGLGSTVGTGAMACSSGISIEAMFISDWSGNFKDYDEIFRKEDGDYRFLLSFQNDENVGQYAEPLVANGPCLSFGLHLEELGYSELDMPLDGREGRPTVAELTDGRPHHVVATYDSFTGKKSLYIDGRLRFEHTFSVGILAISGGSVKACIGNNKWNNNEAFNGIIDEVALYDFGLTAIEIEAHYQNAVRGKPYFDGESQPLAGERWHSIAPVNAGSRQVFNHRTGLPTTEL
ncbi:FecR protein [Rosistilla ulvae]|uniref:FecR protein n=1 Tax=Rosistilla ulvae TaxID=1930277 RepID=A0A517M4V1_9BACT|nr:LamG-like jellyroll fold domain-containing protein [Rosistilla ulvae]QDS89894.1 FecR protein [Rosistilla ulvae]